MYADEGKLGNTSRAAIDNDRWAHDMFDDSDNPPAKPTFNRRENNRRNDRQSGAIPRRQPERLQTRASNAVLMISNLASSVLKEDLDELFEPYSPKSVNLHHDSAGNRVGSATVEVTQQQAEEILKKYNNAELDGKELVINSTAVTGQSTGRQSIHSRLTKASDGDRDIRGSDRRYENRRSPAQSKFKHSGARSSGGRYGHDDRVGNSSRSENNGRNFSAKKKKMTVEELDKQLEDYMKH